MNTKLTRLLNKEDVEEYKRLYSLTPHLVELFIKYLESEQASVFKEVIKTVPSLDQQFEIASLTGKLKALEEVTNVLKSVIIK